MPTPRRSDPNFAGSTRSRSKQYAAVRPQVPARSSPAKERPPSTERRRATRPASELDTPHADLPIAHPVQMASRRVEDGFADIVQLAAEPASATLLHRRGLESPYSPPANPDPVQAKCAACGADTTSAGLTQVDPWSHRAHATLDDEADTAESATQHDVSYPAVQAKCAACATGAPCAACAQRRGRRTPVVARSPVAIGPVQTKCSACAASEHPAAPSSIQAVASRGVDDASSPLPHLDRIQESFGRHDVSQVKVSIGGAAAEASAHMNAEAFTIGDRIGFSDSPDVKLAAHEAAHVVQQRHGVHLQDGVGSPGDPYEQQADEVAEAIVRGASAEPILDRASGAAGARSGVEAPVLRKPNSTPTRAEPGSVGGSPSRTDRDSDGGVIQAAAAQRGAAAVQLKDDPTAAQPVRAARCADIDFPVEKPPEDMEASEPPKEPEGGEVKEDIVAEEQDTPTEEEQPCEDIAAEGEQATMVVSQQAEVMGNTASGPQGAAPQNSREPTPEQGAISQPAKVMGDAENGPVGAGPPSGGGEPTLEQGATTEQAGDAGDTMMVSRIADAEAARADSIAVHEAATADSMAASAAPGRIAARRVTFSGPTAARAPAEAALAEFFASTATQLDEAVAFARDEVPARVGLAAAAASAAIEAEGERHLAAIETRIAAASAAIETRAATASAWIDAACGAAVARIEAATAAALAQVNAAYLDASLRVPEMHVAMVLALETTYTEAEEAYRAVGRTRAAAAQARGATFAAAYRACKINRSDGFWEGHLTDRRAEAAAKAAEQTAKGYADSFLETANTQAGKVRKGLPKDRHTARCTAEQIQRNLDTQYQQTVEGIRAAHQSSLAGAEAQRAAAQAQVAAQRAQAIATLDAQRPGLLRAVRETTHMQVVATEHLAHSATGALQLGITAAAQSLDAAMASLAASLQGTAAPAAKALTTLLANASGQRDAALATLQTSTTEGLVQVEGNLQTHTNTATTQLGELADGAIDQVGQLEQCSSEGIDAVAADAEQGLSGHAAQHASSVQGMANGVVEGFQALVESLRTQYETLLTTLTKTVGEATKSLESSFDKALAGLDEKIPVEASDAASHEPPAWKTIVKWVLVIAIVIVIAFVAGPAAIGFLAGYGMSTLAAGVVAGAVLGAVAGGLNQVVSNWETNRRWNEGLGHAIVMGAITGAFGGLAGGLVSSGISKVITEGLRRTVVDFAANVVLDAAMDLGFQLHANGWDFGKINWTDFAVGLGMSIAMNGVQARAQHGSGTRPHANGPEAGPTRPAIDAPDVSPSRPHVETPDAGPPRPPTDTKLPRPADADPTTPGTPPKRSALERLADFQQRMHQRGAKAAETLRGPDTDAHAPRPVNEMTGRGKTDETPNLDKDPDAPARSRTDEDLLDATTLADVDGEPHQVAPRRIGNEVKLFACSNRCAPITQKIDDALAKLPPDSPLGKSLVELRESITNLEGRIDRGEVDSHQIIAETNRVAKELSELGGLAPVEVNAILDQVAHINDTETQYIKYCERNRKNGRRIRPFDEWKVVSELMTQTGPTARGNEYNEHVNDSDTYRYTEVVLQNGKRVDGYNPPNKETGAPGEIVSRKETDFTNPNSKSTMKAHMEEMLDKYKPGELMNSPKYGTDLTGKPLEGDLILEVPARNQATLEAKEIEAMAAKMDPPIKIRYTRSPFDPPTPVPETP